jgi:acyl-CoA thioesterase-1
MHVAAHKIPRATGRVRAHSLVITHLLFVVIALVVTAGCSGFSRPIANLDSSGTSIVCFGDSITAGYGVMPQQAYPALIAENVDLPVINAGRDGDRVVDGLARLDTDVFPHKPRVVIVEFGGNDFLKGGDREEAFRNLDLMVARIAQKGSMVVLLGLRTGIIRDSYGPDYKRIAKAHGALLIPNFMSGIITNPRMTVDGIHPSPEGHKLIAGRVLEKLVPLLEESERQRVGK